MSGLGGLNKSPNGVVIGLVQLQLPVVETPARPRGADRSASCDMVGKARRNLPARWTSSSSPSTRCTACRWTPSPSIMCSLDGPEVAAFKAGLRRATASGAASRSWS